MNRLEGEVQEQRLGWIVAIDDFLCSLAERNLNGNIVSNNGGIIERREYGRSLVTILPIKSDLYSTY